MANKEQIKAFLQRTGLTKKQMKKYWEICAVQQLQFPYPIAVELDEEYESEYTDDCSILKEDGVKWKMLPIELIPRLPQMAAPYLEQGRQEENHIQLQEEDMTDPTGRNLHRIEMPDTETVHTEEPEEPFSHLEEYQPYQRTSIEEIQADKIAALSQTYQIPLYEAEILYHLKHQLPLSESNLRYLAFDKADSEYRQYGDSGRWNRSVCDIIQFGDEYYALNWYQGLTEMQEDEFFEQPQRVYPKKRITMEENTVFTADMPSAEENESRINEVYQILEAAGISHSDNVLSLPLSHEAEQAVEQKEDLELEEDMER